jgi:polygalacturonase
MEVVDVRSLGAKGDGLTDDTAAIQAALNATPRSVAVYCPATAAGYLVNGTLTIPKGRVLLGDYTGSAGTRWAEARRT